MTRGHGFISIIILFSLPLITPNHYLFALKNGSLTHIDPGDTQKVPQSLHIVISIDLDHVPFEEALITVAQKGGFKLNFSSTRLKVQKKITLKMENTPAIQVLQKILNGTGSELRITRGGQFVIIPKKAKNSGSGAIHGKIEKNPDTGRTHGVQVRLIDTAFHAMSNENGEFRISNIPAGNYNIKIAEQGFKTILLKNILIRAHQDTFIRIEMEPELPQIEEFIHVTGNGSRRDMPDARVINMTGGDIQKTPGVIWGVNRMLDAVPGVSALSDVNTDLIVRGGGPSENGFYIDNIEIPTIDHLPRLGSTGGFYSALNPDLIQNVDLFSSGFGSNYGGRLSSVIDITLREGNREKFEAQLDLNMAMLGGVFEGPIQQKGSWLVSFRKSHLGVLRDMGFDLESIPGTFDSQVKLVFNLSPAHKISFLNFYSRGDYNQENEVIPFFHNRNYDHHTAGLNMVSIWNETFFSNTSIFFTRMKRYDEQKYWYHDIKKSLWNLSARERYFGVRNSNFLRLNEKSKLEFGFQIKSESSEFELSIPDQIEEFDNISQESHEILPYGTTKYSLFFTYQNTLLEKLDVTMGLRGDVSSTPGIFHLSPRLNLTYRPGAHIRLNGGIGVFYQSLPTCFLASLQDMNDVRDITSILTTAGLEYVTSSGLRIQLDVYHKRYKNLPFNPDSPNALLIDAILDEVDNFVYEPNDHILPSSIEYAGEGYSSGIELLWQQNVSKRLYYLVNGCYFRSRYRDLQGVLRNRIFDNRYIINLLCGYHLNPDLRFSIKCTFVGGAPFTPVDIDRSIESNDYVFDQSKFLDERYPAYQSISLRIDKNILFKNSSICLYLDIMNIFDRENVYYYYWNLSSKSLDTEDQINIIPIFGIKYEF